jgi:epoxyqueuosine reductase QueG
VSEVTGAGLISTGTIRRHVGDLEALNEQDRDRAVSRKLYSIDYWGHVQRDRRAEKQAAKGAGIGLMGKSLMILGALALLVIIASVLA